MHRIYVITGAIAALTILAAISLAGSPRPTTEAGSALDRGSDYFDVTTVFVAEEGYGGGGWNRVALRIDRMVLHVLAAHRLERTVPDVQRHLHAVDAFRGKRSEQWLGQMEAGRGRGDRAPDPRVHRLIALAVGVGIRATDVGRQRHMPDGVDVGIDVACCIRVFAVQMDGAPAEVPAFENLPIDRPTAGLEPDSLADTQLLPRVDQRIPAPSVQTLEQQTFDRTAAGNSMSQQAGWKHSRVIDRQDIARLQPARE